VVFFKKGYTIKIIIHVSIALSVLIGSVSGALRSHSPECFFLREVRSEEECQRILIECKRLSINPVLRENILDALHSIIDNSTQSLTRDDARLVAAFIEFDQGHYYKSQEYIHSLEILGASGAALTCQAYICLMLEDYVNAEHFMRNAIFELEGACNPDVIQILAMNKEFLEKMITPLAHPSIDPLLLLPIARQQEVKRERLRILKNQIQRKLRDLVRGIQEVRGMLQALL